MRSDVPKTRSEVKELERLRQLFLDAPESPGVADYWSDANLLALYDRTFARRICWKWDALCSELKAKNWSVPSPITRWIDWGCGSGVATESVLNHLSVPDGTHFVVSDRSPSAMQFAADKIKKLSPQATVSQLRPEHLQVSENDLLLISHVLTELTDDQTHRLLEQISHAGAILWVEPGTPYCSKKLIAARKKLLSSFSIVGPCPHQSACGISSESKDWCHFFAPPPSEIFQDPAWMHFAKTMKIDLRSLPISFLAAERQSSAPDTELNLKLSAQGRLIGRPRFYKGHARAIVCQGDGVREKNFLEREHKATFKEWQREPFYIEINTVPDSD